MNLDELRSVQSKERRKDSLQQLRDSFYADVATYIADLQTTRDRRAEQVSNPFSDDEVRRLSDELETAEEVAEAVFERRVGKVVKLASFAAADMSVGNEGMTSEERNLFDDLVSRIKQNKRDVLDILAGGGDTRTAPATPDTSSPARATDTSSPAQLQSETSPTHPSDSDHPVDPAAPDENVLAAAMGSVDDQTDAQSTATSTPSDADGGGPDQPDNSPLDSADDSTKLPTTDGGNTPVEPADSPTGSPIEPPTDPSSEQSTTTNEEPPRTDSKPSATDTSRTMVRITEDVGEIFGVDEREYTLHREDVVTLPSANAKPLVDRDAAMRLD